MQDRGNAQVDDIEDDKENNKWNDNELVIDDAVYEAPFGERNLTKGETAVAMLMIQAAEYDREPAERNLRDALQDAYMAILMKQAVETGEVVASEIQAWHKNDI